MLISEYNFSILEPFTFAVVLSFLSYFVNADDIDKTLVGLCVYMLQGLYQLLSIFIPVLFLCGSCICGCCWLK